MYPPEGIDLNAWFRQLTESVADVGAKRYRYGPDPENVADLRVPSGRGAHPVIVILHGGAFRARYGSSIMNAIAIDLVHRGYATWNVEYRRAGCGGGARQTTADVVDALNRLRELSSEFSLDLDRMVVLGHSSGGYLALWSAQLACVRYVMALAPVTNFRMITVDPNGPYAQFIGGMPDELPDEFDFLDLPARFPTGARQVMVCGAADEASRLEENRWLAKKACDAGEDLTYTEIPGANHYTFIDPATAAWQLVARRLSEYWSG